MTLAGLDVFDSTVQRTSIWFLARISHA
jgi:hypothetical protein